MTLIRTNMKSSCEFVEKIERAIENSNSIGVTYETTKRGIVIGVCGSACAGKTTLVNELKPILEKELGVKVGVVEEVARIVFDKYFSDYESLSKLRAERSMYYTFQQLILTEQMLEEWRMRALYDIVLCDRTIFDVFLYAYTYLPIEYVMQLYKEFERWSSIYSYRGYDGVIQLKPLSKFEDDGFRERVDFMIGHFHDHILHDIVPYSSYCRKYYYEAEEDLNVRFKNALEFVKEIYESDVDERSDS